MPAYLTSRPPTQQPERPLASGTWLCDCDECIAVLRATVARDPRLPLVLKTLADSVTVTAEYAFEAWDRTGALEALCFVRWDYIRQVFVGWLPLRPPYRWRSLMLAEQLGLSQAYRRVAARSATLTAVGGEPPDHPRLPRSRIVP